MVVCALTFVGVLRSDSFQGLPSSFISSFKREAFTASRGFSRVSPRSATLAAPHIHPDAIVSLSLRFYFHWSDSTSMNIPLMVYYLHLWVLWLCPFWKFSFFVLFLRFSTGEWQVSSFNSCCFCWTLHDSLGTGIATPSWTVRDHSILAS